MRSANCAFYPYFRWLQHAPVRIVRAPVQGDKGTTESMQAQLVYRDTSDSPVYGTVFSSGQNTVQIPNGVRNGIVNLMVAVTNMNGTGAGDDGSGKGFDAQEHFNYQAQIVSGGVIAPNTTRPW